MLTSDSLRTSGLSQWGVPETGLSDSARRTRLVIDDGARA
jgi:hypothetical protein